MKRKKRRMIKIEILISKQSASFIDALFVFTNMHNMLLNFISLEVSLAFNLHLSDSVGKTGRSYTIPAHLRLNTISR